MGVSIYFLSAVASADHVCLMEKVRPLHTRTRPASLYLNTQCGQTSSARDPFHLQHSRRSSSFSSISSASPRPVCLSFITLLCLLSAVFKRENHLYGTLLRQQTHTQPLFSVTIPHIYHHQTLLLCSSSVIQLSSKCIQPPPPPTHSFICYLFLVISTNTSSPLGLSFLGPSIFHHAPEI